MREGLMMDDYPLSLTAIVERAERFSPQRKVVFRRPDGSFESYRIPWAKSGLPLTTVGRYITPNAAGGEVNQDAEDDSGDYDPAPNYMQPLSRLWNCQLPDRSGQGQAAAVRRA